MRLEDILQEFTRVYFPSLHNKHTFKDSAAIRLFSWLP